MKNYFPLNKRFLVPKIFDSNYRYQLLHASVDYLLTWIYYQFRTPGNKHIVESVF